jgi:LAO/AO transport system kinase
MIDMDQKKYKGGRWKPPVLTAEAVFDKGVTEFLEAIEKHRTYLIDTSGAPHLRDKEKVREELADIIKNRLIQEVFNQLTETGEFEEAVESISKGKTDPYTACDNIILPKLGLSNG